MEELASFIKKIQGNGVTFWLGAIAGVALILIARVILLKILKKKFNTQKTKLFVNTIINWVTFFILLVYFFTYFSKPTFFIKHYLSLAIPVLVSFLF